MAPIRALGKPIFESVAPVDYVALQRSWDNSDPRNQGQYVKGGFIDDFPTELADKLTFVTWDADGDATPHVDYIRKYWKTVEAYTDGFYTNDAPETSDKLRHSNYQGNFARLLKVKQQYGPTNLFRLNTNINPSA